MKDTRNPPALDKGPHDNSSTHEKPTRHICGNPVLDPQVNHPRSPLKLAYYLRQVHPAGLQGGSSFH